LISAVFRDLSISNGRLKSSAPDFGRNLLDRRRRNVYKNDRKQEGYFRADYHRQIDRTRTEAHRRGWMIHPRDVAVRMEGLLSPFFIIQTPKRVGRLRERSGL
jgi:hypothetical protein